MSEEKIRLNLNDYDSMIKLMDDAAKYKKAMKSINKSGENIVIIIDYNSIRIRTNQSNGLVREDIYWRDHKEEKLFLGKWR